ncbi:MAG: SDR family oxidoreductase [Patescibacteria group bacterium]
MAGKTALITGGAGYFGKEFVRGLLDSGARVIVIEKPEVGYEVRDSFKGEYPGRTFWHEVNLFDEKATDKVYTKILKEHQVDILINNAFVFGSQTGFYLRRRETIKSATHDEFRNAFEAGIWWAVQSTKKFGLAMKERGGGSIINITSSLGVIAPSPTTYEGFKHSINPPAYSVVKAGLLHWTRYSASFLAPVRVNALSPGAIPNLKEGHHKAGKEYDDGFLPSLAKKMVLSRCGKVHELVGPLIFLASDASSYVTGHNLLVDGGWTVI